MRRLADQPTDGTWVGCGGLALRAGPRGGVPAPRRRPVAGRRSRGDARLARRRSAGARRGMPRDRRRGSTRAAFELANAVMHTSGQPFVMAFQAGGPHAQDRAIEAIVAGLVEQERVPTSVTWEKPAKDAPIRMVKDYRIVPRGVALVVGCNTFPTWNAYPGHLRVARHRQPGHRQAPSAGGAAARDHGGDRARRCCGTTGSTRISCSWPPRPTARAWPDAGRAPRGRDHRLHRRPAVRRVAGARGRRARRTGVHREGRRQHGRRRLDRQPAWRTGQPRVLAGAVLRPDVHDATERLRPRGRHRHRRGTPVVRGARRPAGRGRSASSPATTPGPWRSSAPRSTTRSAATPRRSRSWPSAAAGPWFSRRVEVTHPAYPDAVVRAPGLVALDAASEEVYTRECFGPVTFLIRTTSTEQSLDRFVDTVREHGAMTAAVWSTSRGGPRRRAGRRRRGRGRPVREPHRSGLRQPDGGVLRLHGTGANPAANAAYTDAAFVANRFRVVTARRHV